MIRAASPSTPASHVRRLSKRVCQLSQVSDRKGQITRLGLSIGVTNTTTNPELITSYTHDTAGRLASKTLPAAANTPANAQNTIAGIQQSYSYDAANRLIQIKQNNNAPSSTTATYSYDADNRRVQTNITSNGTTNTTPNSVSYIYAGSQSVGEIRNQQLSHSLMTGLQLDEQIARIALNQGATPQLKTMLTDALGSVIAIARADQSLEVGYAYSPYGQTQKLGVENQQTGSENNSQYTGRENDQNGLYYYRARYYDPVLKRFISEDPIGLAGGINKFAYVEGDPISLVDPEGRMGVVSVLAMLGGTGWATYQGYLAGQQFGVAQCKSNRTFDEREQSENWKPAQKLARASDQLNNLIATGGPIAARVGVGIAVAGAGGKFLGTATAFGGASLGFYLGQKDCKCP